MTSPPRLVATDLDGTALRTDGTVSPRTSAAFAQAEQSGATVVLVTGRPPRWMHPVAEAMGHRGIAVCANGALVYDLRTERVIESCLIAPDVLAESVARLREHLPGLAFSVEYETGFAYESHFRLGGWDVVAHDGQQVDTLTLVAKPGAKLLAQHPAIDPDELYRQVSDLMGDLVTPTYSGSRSLIEMSALGVTKAAPLAALAADWRISAEEAVAFGDMPNDLPMLAWAGTSYAVANAHPDVLAAVDHVTTANNDDGVALVLEAFYS